MPYRGIALNRELNSQFLKVDKEIGEASTGKTERQLKAVYLFKTSNLTAL